MNHLPSQVVSVRGDTTAKQRNEQPAYSRVSIMREVAFACRRCGQDVCELRYPGPLPKYCPSCRALIEQVRNEERVRRQRERRKTVAAQRNERRAPAQGGVPEVEREQTSPQRQAEAKQPEPSLHQLLPETTRLLNQIERTSGAELAAAATAAITAELEHQRLILDSDRRGLIQCESSEPRPH